jgi:hypothetical protein
MLSVCYRVTDDLGGTVSRYKAVLLKSTYVFKEDLENTTGLLVDETGDTLYTTTTGETTNSRLCYA